MTRFSFTKKKKKKKKKQTTQKSVCTNKNKRPKVPFCSISQIS